jgi:hypothetical protein
MLVDIRNSAIRRAPKKLKDASSIEAASLGINLTTKEPILFATCALIQHHGLSADWLRGKKEDQEALR